jgi:membrane protease YdiL (CAAX protease family)
MTRVRGWLETHPVWGFVALAFGISYLIGTPILVAMSGLLPPGAALARSYAPRVLVTWGPGLAALTMAALSRGGPGAADLIWRLVPATRDIRSVLGILAAAALSSAIAFRVAGVAASDLARALREHGVLLAAHLVLQLVVVGAGEELGWRGWLLPRLVERTSRLRATLVVAAIWTVWHGPLLATGLAFAGTFALGVAGLSVLLSWLALRARSGLFATAVAHAAVNTPLVFLERIDLGAGTPDARIETAWYLLETTYAAAAVLLLMLTWRWWTARDLPRDLASPSPARPLEPAC